MEFLENNYSFRRQFEEIGKIVEKFLSKRMIFFAAGLEYLRNVRRYRNEWRSVTTRQKRVFTPHAQKIMLGVKVNLQRSVEDRE